MYECSCGDSYTVETPPTGVHTESGHIIRKNYLGKTNLSEDGCCLVEHYSVTYGCCTLGCDYHWVANRDKEAHGGGHDIRGYSATCTTEGLSTGWTCSCGKKIREQEILPALGHNYKIRQTENYNEDWTEVEYIELCNRCNLVFRTWWEKLE